MTGKDLILRTKSFALRVVDVVNALPRSVPGIRIADQLFRCGTSVAANYRAACKGRSKAEFVAKLGTVEEEADECAFWLEMIKDTGILEPMKVEPLRAEAYELSRIMAASKMTARSKMHKTRN